MEKKPRGELGVFQREEFGKMSSSGQRRLKDAPKELQGINTEEKAHITS